LTLQQAHGQMPQGQQQRQPIGVKAHQQIGGQQGDERDFVRKIKLGQLDGAAVTAIGLSMIDESIRVLELPMMFATTDEVDYVADKMWPYFQKKFEKKGFKLNDRGEVGLILKITDEVQPGVLLVPGQRPVGEAVSGTINMLCSDRYTDMGEGATNQSTWLEVAPWKNAAAA
jgi:hypothetical protein